MTYVAKRTVGTNRLPRYIHNSLKKEIMVAIADASIGGKTHTTQINPEDKPKTGLVGKLVEERVVLIQIRNSSIARACSRACNVKYIISIFREKLHNSKRIITCF